MSVRGITELAYSIDFNWTTEAGAWTVIPIKSIHKEAFGISDPEEFITEKVDETEQLDGVKQELVFLTDMDEAVGPPVNGTTPVWFRIVSGETSGWGYWFGGSTGSLVRRSKSGIRSLQTGQHFQRHTAVAAGIDSDAIIKFITGT